MSNLFLADAQKREFDDNGFLVFEDLMSPAEVERYLGIIDRIDRTCPQTHGGPRNSRKPGEHLELRNAVAYDPELMELLADERLFPAIVDLMGHNICMTTSHVFIRPPSPPGTKRDYKAIGWHKDGPATQWTPAMNGQWPWLYTKIGWFFTDTTIPDAGALRVVPGSHKTLRPAWKPGEPDPYGAIEVKLKPGSAVLFENRLWHAVGPNYSNVPRKNVYFGYCWRWMRPIDYVQQPAELMARCTPVQRQLMGAVSSSLGYILPQDDDVPLKAWAEARLAERGAGAEPKPPVAPSAAPAMI